VFDWASTGIALIKNIVVVVVLLAGVVLMAWAERRIMGLIQFRWGPNRVGPFGLLQTIADGIKLLMKEEVAPADAHRPIFILAPGLAVATALCAFAVVPFGPTIRVAGRAIEMVILDLDGGVLFWWAATALGVYGIVCAGWSSRSKYSLMGGLRSSAQMVSYELTLSLSVIGVLLVSGTLRPVEIVERQAGGILNWNLFGGFQLLGFLLFLVAGFAETNRLPFDLPEAESELVAGYHTEYSSMKLLMFYIAEYIAMMTMAGMVTTLFLGGYHLPVPAEWLGLGPGWTLWVLQTLMFLLKVGLFMFLFVWVRWTLPRFRYDQLMSLGWKRLFPLALANVLLTGVGYGPRNAPATVPGEAGGPAGCPAGRIPP
jgi:NADH-quinone oxidoreductase subunit H